MKFKIIFSILIFFLPIALSGQSVIADFAALSQVCINQNVKLVNQSTQADRYEWDFCQGDLQLTPNGNNLGNLGGSVTTGIDVVFDGTNWFGFVTSQNTNSILRLDYGSDLKSTPMITNLGNISGKINSPTDIKIIKEGSNWFGFVYGLADPLLSRIDFGSSLTNTTVSTNPISAEIVLSGAGSVNGGFDIMYAGGNWVISLTLNSSFTIVRLPSVNGTPMVTDVISNINNPFGVSLGDIVLLASNGNYFGYVVAYGNKSLQRLSFGSNLFSTPTIDNIPLPVISGISPYGIDGSYDNGIYTLFISTLEGTIIRVSLGSDLSTINVTGNSLGNFSVLENTLKIKILKNQSDWFAFSPSWSTTRLYRLDFPKPVCQLSSIITEDSPNVKFQASGLKSITLRAFKNGGEFSEISKTIDVSSSVAPGIDINFTNICINSTTNFQVISADPIQTYNWDFGDLATSTNPNPTHQYLTTGLFNVSLSVSNANGCFNTTDKAVKIYNAPIASFILPSGLVCTNNEFLFENTTPDSFDGNLSYQWFANTIPIATARNLTYAFTASGDQEIKLQTSIPGCMSESIQTLTNIQEGAEVNFLAGGHCEDEPLIFTNNSIGDIVSYQWDFGDGQSSSVTRPTHTYQNKGDFQVALNAQATNGCVSTSSQLLTIYSKPQPNFSIDLPPFSCAGSASQFNDLTPALTDSNITTWTWSFGDPANGTSSQKNPTYVYGLAGDYPVSIQTTTNFGCTNSLQKIITISTAPAINFTNGVACLNQGTQFTDVSDGTVKAWLWSIGNSSYSTKNTTHTFNTTGQHDVMITVTGTNNCVSQLTKTVTVPVAPVPDFTAVSTCVNKSTVFQEKNIGGADPAVSWSWDFGGTVGSGSPAQHTFTALGNYSVKMSSTRQSGCVYSITKSIPITQAPKAQFSASPEIGAVPLGVGFTNTSTQATSYLWRFNDANNSTSTEFSPAFVFNQLGSYPVELIASNSIGCMDSYSKTIHVVVPAVNATLSSFKLIPSGNSMKIVVTIKNQGNISILNPEVVVDLAGEFSFTQNLIGTILPNQELTQELPAAFLRSQANYVCADVNVIGDNNPLDNRQCENLDVEVIVVQPYPNPAQNELVIDWINKDDESLSLIIYNSSGQIVLKQKFDGLAPGLNQLRLNVSNLPTGSYYVSHPKGTVYRGSRFSIVR